jgi:hypothetical protein
MTWGTDPKVFARPLKRLHTDRPKVPATTVDNGINGDGYAPFP